VALTSAGATQQDLSVSGVLPTISSVGVDFDAAESATPSSTTATWRLVMSSAQTASVTVNFNVGFQSTPSASTVPGEDYTLSTSAAGVVLNVVGATGNTVLIPAGTSTVDILLTAFDDPIYEGSENVWFQVVAGTGYTPNANNSFVNITDNDSLPAVSVSATDNAAAEGTPATDTAVYTITLSNPSAFATTIDFSMGGSAGTAPGGDYSLSATGGTLSYTGPSGSITLAALTTSVTVTLTTVDDSAVEGAENATLTVNSGTGYTVGSPASDTATIADNDVSPTITVAATDNSGSEASASTDTATFTLSLSPAPVATTTLNFTMSGTAATAPGADYTLGATGGTLAYSGPGGTITVAAGVTSVTVTLTVVDDAIVEGATAETAIFTLDAGTGYIQGSPASDTASITDDDIAVVPTVTVSATDAAAAEGTPATDVGEFTIQLTPAPNTALTILFAMSGTASSADYSLSATGGTLTYTAPNGSINIAAGTTVVVVTLTVVNDSASEGVAPESATLTLGAGAGYNLGSSTVDTVDITDNDTPVVSVATADGSAAEAGADTGAWTISLNPAPTSATTLSFSMAGTAAVAPGVDYTLSATGGTLTYTTGPNGTIDVAAGVSSVTVTLTVVDDTLVEGATAETASFTLTAGAGYGVGTPASGNVSIADNDVLPVSITTTSLPDGVRNTLYDQPITATGGSAPYTWSIIAGTQPAGLALSGSTTSVTSLTGVPTTTGAFTFTVEVTDGVTTDTQVFTVTITGGGSGGGGGGGDGGGGGCTSRGSGVALLLPVLAVLGAALLRRRRAA
jgi:hypothetical protein